MVERQRAKRQRGSQAGSGPQARSWVWATGGTCGVRGHSAQCKVPAPATLVDALRVDRPQMRSLWLACQPPAGAGVRRSSCWAPKRSSSPPNPCRTHPPHCLAGLVTALGQTEQLGHISSDNMTAPGRQLAGRVQATQSRVFFLHPDNCHVGVARLTTLAPRHHGRQWPCGIIRAPGGLAPKPGSLEDAIAFDRRAYSTFLSGPVNLLEL